MTKLILMDAALATKVRADMKRSLNASTSSIELDLQDTQTCVDALQDLRDATFQYTSIGIVADGKQISTWGNTIRSSLFADALAQILHHDASDDATSVGRVVDLFACNMRANDLNVTDLSTNLGAGISVYFSTNRTGNQIIETHDWEMEKCMRGGVEARIAVERNVKTEYLTEKATQRIQRRQRRQRRQR